MRKKEPLTQKRIDKIVKWLNATSFPLSATHKQVKGEKDG